VLVLTSIVVQSQKVAFSVIKKMWNVAGGYRVTNVRLPSILGEGIQASLTTSSIHQTVRNLITRRGTSYDYTI
jgi:hypothetical protein